MNMKVAGARITDDVVKTLATLQGNAAMTQVYLETIDEVTRTIILNIADDDDENLVTLSQLSILQYIRRDLLSLAEPIDVG